MTRTADDMSVIICAYTEARWDDLTAAVESVRQQTLLPMETIVVIDHNPGLLERVREYLPGVIVVENEEARGLSGSRNSGIAASGSRILAFLDDDAIAAPDWLKVLSEGFHDQHVLGNGGSVMPRWSGTPPLWLPEEFYWVVGCTYRGMPRGVAAIRNPIGANMAVRREVFEQVGGYRSGIGRVGKRPVGCEETELCIRAHQRWPGKIFLYQPQAMVYHRVPYNRATWRYFCARCYAEGLSKAVVTRFVGTRDSLASERGYTMRTLPRGMVRGVRDALLHHDLSGLMRAGAIAVGFASTVTGYLVGRGFSMRAGSANILTAPLIPRRNTETPLSLKAEV